jgi:NitT/TauT family transport system permease protein
MDNQTAPNNTNDLTKSIHKSYKKAKIREKLLITATQTAILIFFMGLWEISGRLQWIDELLFSYPSKIIKLMYSKFADGSLYPHIGMTLAETIIGFVLGTLMGTMLAALIWWSPFLARVLDPFIVVLNSMPKVALGPLFIVGLGPGLLSIIAMTLAITVIITTLVIYNSFKEVDANYIKVIQIFGGKKREIFGHVVLPASIPTIVSALKVNVGLAWIGVIVGEFLVSKQGLGYLIIYGFQVFNFSLVLGSLFIISIIATLMYQAVAYLERKMERNS